MTSKSSFASKKKSVSRVSTENYSKDISVESRNSSRFKGNKLKESIGAFGTKGYSTKRSNVSVSPVTQIKTYSESMRWRRASNQSQKEGSQLRRKNSRSITGEEPSNMRSPDREEGIRNIQMTAFWIRKNGSKGKSQGSAGAEPRTSLFTFLQKHERKEMKDRLERGYLLLDRKGRIIPSYKSEMKNEQTNVIAFWISGGKYSSPDTLSQDLLAKVKSKLTTKIATKRYL